MIKIVILLALVSLSYTHSIYDCGDQTLDTCYSYPNCQWSYVAPVGCYYVPHVHDDSCNAKDVDQCEAAVNCQWSNYGTIIGCYDAIYFNLGAPRSLEHEVVFSHNSVCSAVINHRDFIARKSFHKRTFRSFCNAINVNAVRVGDTFHTNDYSFDENAHAAIIYPKVPEGTAYLYSRKYFRGVSWVASGPTKLNGQLIKSIMIGDGARLSLFDRHGNASKYVGLEYSDLLNADDVMLGLEDIHCADEIEYVLVEKSIRLD